MNISFKSPYYYFIKYEKVKSMEVYNKFLNWIIGEFDLYQMDELDGVKVYYPNGWFTIKNVSQSEEILDMEILVVCKLKKTGLITFQKIELLYCHLVNICNEKH